MKHKAIKDYMKAREILDIAENNLKAAFVGYKELVSLGRFQAAKEYCRAWPDSSSKVLAFREILIAEKQG